MPDEEKAQDLKVFISTRESSCNECGENLGHGVWITLAGEKGALCLACADLDHLVFLQAGNAALTRRARKASVLSAIVLKWSRSRKRYERQGILVEAEALEKAEAECLSDVDARTRRRERDAQRRGKLDRQFIERFAFRVRELYPRCPPGRESVIAEHACQKYTGRIGRTAAAKDLDEEAVRLAVVAHVRHVETQYSEMLATGWDRWEARQMVKLRVDEILNEWQGLA